MMRGVLACALVVCSVDAGAQTQVAQLRGRIGLEDSVEVPSVVLTALERTRAAAVSLRAFVRLTIDRPALERAAAGDWRAIDERLAAYEQRQIPVLLAIGPRVRSQESSGSWVPVLQATARRFRGRLAGYQIEEAVPRLDPRDYAFELKLASVQIRAIDPGVAIAQATARPGDAGWLAAVYAEGTAPYVDVAPVAAPAAFGDVLDQAVEASIAASDPAAVRIQIGVLLGEASAEGVRRLLTTVVAEVGRPEALGSTFAASTDVLVPALEAAAALKELLERDVLVVDDATVSLAIEVDGRDVTASWPHRIFYGVADGSLYLAYWGGNRGGDVTFSFVESRGRRPVVRDPARGDAYALRDFSWDPATRRARVTVAASPTPLLLDFNVGPSPGFVSRTDVTAATPLSVEEIVARNQQAQAANTNAFRAYIATLRTELHFRPTATQVFDVVTENRFYSGPDTVEWEELSFSVNGAKWGPNRPGLPLLQAEKVLTLPLDIRLTADYFYTLEGTDAVGDRRCYLISFEPARSAESLYRGRVWIDTETFLRLKLQTIQTQLDGPIVSSEATTLYREVPAAQGTPILLPSRQSTKEILLIAGRNVLLEKEQWFDGFQIDPPRFDAEREAARAGGNVMFRETPAGVRYLVKRGAERVVSEDLKTTNKALAFGVTIDPSFEYPLPILGLNYLNFDVRGSGNQLAILFGGVFVAGNLQKPRLGRTPFHASVDFFGIAVPGTDLSFDADGERRGERVLTIPFSAGVNLGYQFSPFQTLSMSYSWQFDAYFQAPETAEDFTVPGSTSTHGVGAAYEYSRHGYRFGAQASVFGRQTWKPWGPADDLRDDGRTYRRYSVAGGKDVLLGPFQTVHVSAGLYGGAGLDRFSAYQFGLFNALRMHGVPASGIRFSEFALLRGSYTFNLLGLYRLDLFLDHARGRYPNRQEPWQSVTGLGVAVTLKAPWDTMLTADYGRSWLPDPYRAAGSTVLQFIVLKPF